MTPSEATHRLVVNVDVQDSGHRDNPGQLLLRQIVYEAADSALAAAEIAASAVWRREDRGDGMLLVLSADVPKSRVVGRWVEELSQALTVRNSQLADPVRARIGIHAGEVHDDRYGVAGIDVNIACRLAGCEPAKSILRAAPNAVVVLAVSDLIYQTVVRHGGPFLYPDTYRTGRLVCSELDGPIWLRAPGYAEPPASAAPSRSAAPPESSQPHPTGPTSASVGRDGVVIQHGWVGGDVTVGRTDASRRLR